MAKTVVITGGTADIGRAIAHRFAEGGWNVAILAQDGRQVRTAAKPLEALGVKALAISADVADAAKVDAAAARIEDELAPIDLWVNAASASVAMPTADAGPEDFRRIADIAYLGTVHGTLAALKHMEPRGTGHVVQLAAEDAAAQHSAYGAATSAGQAFTDSLRAELQNRAAGIQLTQVHLPASDSPLDPRVIARAVFFAAENPRRDIWLARNSMMGTFSHLLEPGLLDRFMAKAGWKPEPDAADSDGTATAELEPAEEGADKNTQKPEPSAYFWTDRHRNAAALGAMALALFGLVALIGLAIKAIAGATAPKKRGWFG